MVPKIATVGDGDVLRSVKHLLREHEDSSSNPQGPSKKQGIAMTMAMCL